MVRKSSFQGSGALRMPSGNRTPESQTGGIRSIRIGKLGPTSIFAQAVTARESVSAHELGPNRILRASAATVQEKHTQQDRQMTIS